MPLSHFLPAPYSTVGELGQSPPRLTRGPLPKAEPHRLAPLAM